ncbi:hypothetical protein M218_26520 [Burkholderia pseudomallei MSHR338]|nr:hypothetical protein M218_26520 [Burkholderia pseudomallei MSHR338]
MCGAHASASTPLSARPADCAASVDAARVRGRQAAERRRSPSSCPAS